MQHSDIQNGQTQSLEAFFLVLKIFWCQNFVERHNFRIVSGNSSETMLKMCLFTKFALQIMVFYAWIILKNLKIWDLKIFQEYKPEPRESGLELPCPFSKTFLKNPD